MFAHLAPALSARAAAGLLRREQVVERVAQQHITVAGRRYLNFSSNDYLGLAQSPQSAPGDDLASGSSGSPLVTGYTHSHRQLCLYLADMTQREAVLLVNSGFVANHIVAQVLFQHANPDLSNTIIADKLAHASIIEGGLASKAKFQRFRHNNSEHLDALLSNSSGNTLVMTESVFSMDGDCAPISDIAQLCQQHGALLAVDDAHGLGVLGQTGSGVVECSGLPPAQLPIIVGTFGKAVGTSGAYIAASQVVIDYIKNFAPHYIYSTAMSPHNAAVTLAKLQQLQREQWRRDALRRNIQLFRRAGQQLGLALGVSQTPIQPIIIGDPNGAVHFSNILKQQGVWALPIRTPTVPKHTDRIRITLTALHTETDIAHLITALAAAQTATGKVVASGIETGQKSG